MPMAMLRLYEIEELFPEEILHFPGTQRLIVDREELPEDFEERTPTLIGISPKQMEITMQSIDEYLEPDIEVIYELEADYEPKKGKVLELPMNLIIYKNKYERYMAFFAAFASIFFMVVGLNKVASSSQIPLKMSVRKMIIIPECIPQNEPNPAGEERAEVMPQNPQKDVLLPHCQSRACDWHETSPKVKIRWNTDTEVELEGVTSEFGTNEFLEPTLEYLYPLIPLAA